MFGKGAVHVAVAIAGRFEYPAWGEALAESSIVRILMMVGLFLCVQMVKVVHVAANKLNTQDHFMHYFFLSEASSYQLIEGEWVACRLLNLDTTVRNLR